MDWPEGKDFGALPEEEVTGAEKAPLYNKLLEDKKTVCPVHRWVLSHCGEAAEVEGCCMEPYTTSRGNCRGRR